MHLQKERLSKPASCPADVWRLIEACWAQEHTDRPSFEHVLCTLRQMQQKMHGHLDLQPPQHGGESCCVVNQVARMQVQEPSSCPLHQGKQQQQQQLDQMESLTGSSGFAATAAGAVAQEDVDATVAVIN